MNKNVQGPVLSEETKNMFWKLQGFDPMDYSRSGYQRTLSAITDIHMLLKGPDGKALQTFILSTDFIEQLGSVLYLWPNQTMKNAAILLRDEMIRLSEQS